MKPPTMLAAVSLAAATLVATTAPAANAADRDCSDFASQSDAQDYFEQKGGPIVDPDRLDSDHDGKACDSLPGPSVAVLSVAVAPGKKKTLPEDYRVVRVGVRCSKHGKQRSMKRGKKRNGVVRYRKCSDPKQVAAYRSSTRKAKNEGTRRVRFYLRSP